MTVTRSTTTKPTSPRHTRAVSLRLTDAQFNHLLVQAQRHGVTQAEAARLIIEGHIERQPDLGHEDGSPGTSMKYRTFLQLADFSAALEELQADASS